MNQPLSLQFLVFLASSIRWDLENSIISGIPIEEEITIR
jgi:peptide/nickel transport system permease protein